MAKPKTGPTRTGTAGGTFAMLGRSGLLALGGRIYDEWDLHLQGYRGRRAYREMADQDSIVGAILFALEMLIRQVHWSVEPLDQTPEAKGVAEFVSQCLDDMEESWPDTLSEILTMLIYGWSYHEILYKVRGGISADPLEHSAFTDRKIGWRSFATRGQESLDRWEFADDQTLLGLWQIPPPDYRIRYVPYAKALLFRTSVRRGNPEGKPILRNAYRDYYFKKNLETVEAISAERCGVGLPVMYAPDNIVSPATSEDITASNAYMQMLQNLRIDEQAGALLPGTRDDKGNRLYELELLKSPGPMLVDTNKIIERKATGIAQSVLADFVQLGQTARGTQALGQSKIQLFNTALAALLDAIASVITTRAIPALCRLNGMGERLPTLTHGEVAKSDVASLGQFIAFLAQAGAELDLSVGSPLLKYLLEEASLPAVDQTPDSENTDEMGNPIEEPIDTQGQQQRGRPTKRPPAARQTPEPGNSTTLAKPPAKAKRTGQPVRSATEPVGG